jgi:hypothetical protein
MERILGKGKVERMRKWRKEEKEGEKGKLGLG